MNESEKLPAGNPENYETEDKKPESTQELPYQGNEPGSVYLDQKEKDTLEEEDRRGIEQARAQIESFGDNDVEKMKEVQGRILQREKVEKLEESSSFEEKFELLKELREEGYKFEITGLVNILSQIMVDFSSAKEKREDFRNAITEAIKRILENDSSLEGFFEEIGHMISVGSGHGENPFGILTEYMPEGSKALLIDPYAAPSGTVAKNENIQHLGQRFEDVKIEIGEGKRNLVEASNFLQLYDEEGKIEMVKKMIRLAGVGGKIIIVDEINREEWTERAQDRLLNKIYNPAQKTYERMDLGDYKGMFESLKLECLALDEYNRGSVLFMLDVTQDAMDMAVGNSGAREQKE